MQNIPEWLFYWQWASGILSIGMNAAAAMPAILALTLLAGRRGNAGRGTRDVLIGNPAIADVAVLDASKAVVTGRGYGVTNLIVIDQLGRTVKDRQVVVSAPEAGRVSVIRGGRVDDYACAAGCERASAERKNSATSR